MSVIVKGMKMPENCDVCKFSDWSNLHQTSACKLCEYEPGFDDFSKDYMERRSSICPLVELPEKHGGLIDGNAFREELDNHYPFTKEEQSRHGMADIAKGELLYVLNKMPIVIEAEGEE